MPPQFLLLSFLDSQSASSNISRAELFNTFFHSIYTVSSFSLPSVDNHACYSPHHKQYVSFSEDEVLHALSALDPTKSTGYRWNWSKTVEELLTLPFIFPYTTYSLSV